MKKPLLAWAIAGSENNIEECLDFLLTLDAVHVYISLAGEEVLKMYSIDNNMLSKKMPVYHDKTASTLPCRIILQRLLSYIYHGSYDI